MSNRFDSALLNRENTRRALAEALDQKYDSERRRAKFAQIFVLGVVGGVVYYVCQGALFVAEHTKPMDLAKKKNENILEQMKKQMSEGDQLMIGGKKRNSTLRSTGSDKSQFENKAPPSRLASELAPKPAGKNSPGYSPKQAKEAAELEQRKARKGKPGPYRDSGPKDLAKLPPPPRPRSAPPAQDGRYIRVAGPGPRLASDLRAFPDLQK